MTEWIYDGVKLEFPEQVTMTPDLGPIARQYPQYKATAEKEGRDPIHFASFLWTICKEAAKRNDFGRDADTWQQRYIEHFGFSEVTRLNGASQEDIEYAEKLDFAKLVALAKG